MLRITLVLFIVGVAVAQINSNYPCPKPQGLKDFDVNRYGKIWYEFANYTDKSAITTKCVTDIHVPHKDGSFEIITTQKKLVKSKTYTTKYTATPVGDPRNGKFRIISTDEPYDVLATDYINWAFVSSCKTYNHVSVRAAVILTRSRNPSNQVTGQAYAAAKVINLKKSDFVVLNQQGCPKS